MAARKKQVCDLITGDVINPPKHQQGWLWRDGTKRRMTVIAIVDSAPDIRGKWMTVNASFQSPYGEHVQTSMQFRMRPDKSVRLF